MTPLHLGNVWKVTRVYPHRSQCHSVADGVIAAASCSACVSQRTSVRYHDCRARASSHKTSALSKDHSTIKVRVVAAAAADRDPLANVPISRLVARVGACGVVHALTKMPQT